ncbi:MAG TPA: tetratricopeptide repeat protein, partial [Oceanobacillus sp.]|nr:tetratricopeptide repeat protein [Oceanobacillus sp.]
MANNPSSSNPISGLQNRFGEITGLAAAAILLFATVARLIPGPLPYTAAAAVIFICTVRYCGWRLSAIRKEKPEATSAILRNNNSTEERQKPRFGRFDCIDWKSTTPYQFTYPRRCLELVVILLLIVFCVVWILSSRSEIEREFNGIAPLVCTPTHYDPSGMTVLVAQFNQVAGTPSLIEERTFDTVASHLVGDLRVCSIEQVISKQIDARNLASRLRGVALVVWGRIDAAFEINVEVTGEGQGSRNVFRLASGEVLDNFTFQLDSSQEINVVIAFAVSQLFYSNDRVIEARTLLSGALDTAEQRGVARTNSAIMVEPYFFLGFLFDQNDSTVSPNFDEAIEAYSRAILLDPTYYPAYLNRAIAYVNNGQIEEAIADYQVLTDSQSPFAQVARLNLAGIYIEQGDRQAAEREFAAAIEFDPSNPNPYTSRGWAYEEWGESSRALNDFETAVQLEPQDPYRYHDLGMAQLRAGQTTEAIATYQQALPYLTPDDAEFILEDLNLLAEELPELAPSIHAII